MCERERETNREREREKERERDAEGLLKNKEAREARQAVCPGWRPPVGLNTGALTPAPGGNNPKQYHFLVTNHLEAHRPRRTHRGQGDKQSALHNREWRTGKTKREQVNDVEGWR